MGELVRVWAWSKPGVANFGDELGLRILLRLGVRAVRVKAASSADLVTCGSIMSHVSGRDTIVWGTGDYQAHPVDASKLDIRAVRGALTAAQVGAPNDTPLGDPGVLVGRLWGRRFNKKWRTGWFPHYRQQKADCPVGVDRIIDPTLSVDAIIDEIGYCATLASASLHGLIVADSMSIPTMRLSDKRILGGDYKYLDYLSGRHEPHLGRTQNLLINAIWDLL